MVIEINSNASTVYALFPELGTCPINDPINLYPAISGTHGRAWQCDIEAGRRKLGLEPGNDGLAGYWVVEAPWAHPGWHSYSLVLLHLRSTPGDPEPTIYLDGATHELWVYAMNPEVDRNPVVRTGIAAGCWLTPINFSAQFIEITDDLAVTRIEQTIQTICDGKLSPDVDFRGEWAGLFGSNMLKKDWK